MIGAALTIARVKFVLEIRRREVIFAMLLFLAATIVIVRVALSGDSGAGTRAAAAGSGPSARAQAGRRATQVGSVRKSNSSDSSSCGGVAPTPPSGRTRR